MGDWDPYAEEEVGDAASQAAAGGAADGEQLFPIRGSETKIRGSDLARVMKDVSRKLEKEAPWKVLPDSRPDLGWHTPSCTLEAWKHTDVRVEVGQGIVYVTLSRPDTNNALGDGVVAALCDVILLLHGREDIRVVVFTGEGKMFSCGRDPKGDAFGCKVPTSLGESHPDAQDALSRGAFPDGKPDMGRLLAAKMLNAWATLPQFTICLANGSALGEGVGCMVCCDMAIGLRTSFFGFPDTKLGCVSAMVSPYVLAKTSANVAKKMFVLGQLMTAEEACQSKLLNRVVESLADGHKVVKEMCEEISKCGPQSMRLAKEVVLGSPGGRWTRR
jgi:enoyl-CoA hydratase/carnithine racemase